MKSALMPPVAAMLALSAAIDGATPASAQQMAGSLEAGLQTLARALVANAPAGQRPAMSVMPFPSADQSCPVLSVSIVDELTTALVNAVQPKPRVVERMQLETIISQNRLDDFLSDPEQRRRLGGLSGINALVVGSFVVIGDRLRINARLVGMDNGEVMAAEAVSVPRTSEITEFLRQSSNRGQNCIMRATNATPARSASGAPALFPPSTSTNNSPQAPASDQACDEQDGLRVCAQGLRRSGRDVQATLQIENAGSGAVAVAVVGPQPSLTDSDGVALPIAQLSGLPICGNQLSSRNMQANQQTWCLMSDSFLSRHAFRSLPPGGRARMMMQFKANEASTGSAFTLSAALGVLPRLPSGMTAAEAQQLRAKPFIVMLPDLRPTDQSGR